MSAGDGIGRVYFILDHATARIKIGTTMRPGDARVRGQIASAASRQTCLGYVAGGRDMEQTLHWRFKAFRALHAVEWFEPGEPVIDYLTSEGIALPQRDSGAREAYYRLRSGMREYHRELQKQNELSPSGEIQVYLKARMECREAMQEFIDAAADLVSEVRRLGNQCQKCYRHDRAPGIVSSTLMDDVRQATSLLRGLPFSTEEAAA